MKRSFYKARFILFPIGAAAILSLISFVVMQLWNILLPAILHVGIITFWQAMGIFILCKILFGFGKGGKPGWARGNSPWMRKRMEERFKNMSPEDKERFKAKMKDRMCGWGDHHHGGFNRRPWDDFATNEEKQD
ncbi:hypothetical protein [Mucilaginibacter sp. FT3.2]|uniref:hypothetical protein n=1 Tax=Mucilaginibacter sp. FT3.2 TaxID=2723090 RepID=UPI00161A04C7|nr:hypothetical protein [Mucilaginibacter sp. FT3.2]MBB6233206.1 hypothetical protein [Mucilaginibacter sp. FT3.2]